MCFLINAIALVEGQPVASSCRKLQHAFIANYNSQTLILPTPRASVRLIACEIRRMGRNTPDIAFSNSVVAKSHTRDISPKVGRNLLTADSKGTSLVREITSHRDARHCAHRSTETKLCTGAVRPAIAFHLSLFEFFAERNLS